MATPPFALTAAEVLRSLQSNVRGLNAQEIAKRQLEFGRNILPAEKQDSWWLILLRQLNSAMVYVLLVASTISFALHDNVDAGVILAAVVLNVAVGFFQEYRADQSLTQLKQLVAEMAMVCRDGQVQQVATTELVPGDVLVLSAGDHISADARLLQTDSLESLESTLTGESESVAKSVTPIGAAAVVGDQTNMVFAGTSVTNGSGRAVVVATGAHTELGQIAAALRQEPERPTPLQKQLNRFSRVLAALIGVLTLILFLIGLLSGRPLIDTFTLAVAVAVSALPEGLIIGVTVILAVGMKRILKQNGLVRRLASAETLGSVTVICTDKTGTLTEGKMRVDRLVTWDHSLGIHREHPERELAELYEVITIGLLNNDAQVLNPKDEVEHWKVTGNLTERALLMAGASLGLDHQQLQTHHPRIHALPFNSTTKYMATLHTTPTGDHVLHVKGAPERVLQMCTRLRVDKKAITMSPQQRARLCRDFNRMSTQGLRVLALAYSDMERGTKAITPESLHKLVFAGFIGIKDGLRPQAISAVQACHQAGIQVKMITGDHQLTAQAIAQELGLASNPEQILNGEELARLSEQDLELRLPQVSVFARVSPQDKLRIVHALQRLGHVVAMTGDGVNDAPALKAADIGVALGSGTDVAKDAADLVILDDNFQTIVVAVQEGRAIYDNITKTVFYLVSTSFAEILLVITSLLLNLPLVLTAAQILWINLVTDTFPNLALTQEPPEATLMQEPPRSPKTRIINQRLVRMTIITSGIAGFGSLASYILVWKLSGSIELARSSTFVVLSLISLLVAFSVRSLRRPFWKSNLSSNPTLVVALAGGGLAIVLATSLVPLRNILHTTAITPGYWMLIIGLSLGMLALTEVLKSVFVKRPQP